MNKNETLNDVQKKLAADHIDIVKWAIYRHIRVNENSYGLGYDDLFQEGCILLCKAAISYDGNLAQFETYAQVVVKNGLIDYCRGLYNRRKNMTNMTEITNDSDDGAADISGQEISDTYDSLLSDSAVFDLLESVKVKYTGVNSKVRP